MGKEIKWTKEAESSFENIINYLSEKWTDKEIQKFISVSNRVIKYISKNPFLFRKSEKSLLREALISKNILLIYRVQNEQIELILFWDTRRNPKKKHKNSKKR